MILPIIVRSCLLGVGAERPFAVADRAEAAQPEGESRFLRGTWKAMRPGIGSDRFDSLPRRRVLGREVPVASGYRARLLGLAGLRRERAGAGLLLPRCASVHTFGMRFRLDLVFLDSRGRPLAVVLGVPPCRLVGHRGAAAVLEIPSAQGGEFAAPGT
jgi:uncharacterized membrane protein (UPF0127 family)